MPSNPFLSTWSPDWNVMRIRRFETPYFYFLYSTPPSSYLRRNILLSTVILGTLVICIQFRYIYSSHIKWAFEFCFKKRSRRKDKVFLTKSRKKCSEFCIWKYIYIYIIDLMCHINANKHKVVLHKFWNLDTKWKNVSDYHLK
jgi:hypothetical protein